MIDASPVTAAPLDAERLGDGRKRRSLGGSCCPPTHHREVTSVAAIGRSRRGVATCPFGYPFRHRFSRVFRCLFELPRSATPKGSLSDSRARAVRARVAMASTFPRPHTATNPDHGGLPTMATPRSTAHPRRTATPRATPRSPSTSFDDTPSGRPTRRRPASALATTRPVETRFPWRRHIATIP